MLESADKYDKHLLRYYVKLYGDDPDDRRNAASTSAIIERIKHRFRDGSARAMDIGCGAGDLVRFMASIGIEAHGVDIVPHPHWFSTVSEAVLNEEARIERGTYHVGFFPQVVPSGEFDLIVDNGCFHHQHPSARAHYLDSIRQRLKPTGVFFVTIFDLDAKFESVSENHGDYAMMRDGRTAILGSPELIAPVLKRAGFMIESVSKVRRPNGDPFCLLTEATLQAAASGSL